MVNTKNIILMASITAALGLGIIAFQTNNVAVDSLMDNKSDILDFGETTEITTLSHTPGHKGPLKADETFGENRIKCSLSSVLKCTVINSGDGLNRVTLSKVGSLFLCDDNDTRDGAKRGSVDTRRNLDPGDCDYVAFAQYQLDIEPTTGGAECYAIDSTFDSLEINDNCPTAG